jgi:mono/diheme cytochrome c family protein
MRLNMELLRRGVVAGLVVMTAGCKFGTYAETRADEMVRFERSQPDRMSLGAGRFLLDDLGGLNTDTLATNAFPWKVVVAALLLEQASRTSARVSADQVPALFAQYGWISTSSIDNWPGKPPVLAKPIGIVSGEIRKSVPKVRLEVANMGCAACHAGMSYDAEGNATGRVWLGSPNTSRYFDGYTRDILRALRYVRGRDAELLGAIKKVFPDVHPDEIATIRKYVLPQIEDRLRQADESKDILVQFGHGAAGLTNGIAALKLRLDAKPSLLGPQEVGYASIPDLYGRRLRSSVLYDGLYSLRPDQRFTERRLGNFSPADHDRLSSIVAFFIVPSMGIKPTLSEKQAGRIGDILHWVLDYRPQPFPGTVDRALALEGSQIYAAKCASCHGTYTSGIDNIRMLSYPNRLVPQNEMGTDPERWRAITPAMVRTIDRTPVGKKVNAANANGYVAPILNGLWASAPYLHNGSVPTLHHLLNPQERPSRFYVGGHKLDFARVGIAGESDDSGTYRYPSGYRPWSTAVLVDTRAAGLGNRGHEKEFNALSPGEKSALLEYLKLL